MQVTYRALVLPVLMVAVLSGCDYTSTESDSGAVAASTATSSTGTKTGSTSPPGFSSAGSISGSDDSVVATASTGNLAVVVGATQTLSITFASSDD